MNQYEEIEQYRREVKSVPTEPVPGMVDYAEAGNHIARAMHHLDEGLPGGQKRRCELSYAMLKQGVEELGAWMKARGYSV